MPEYTHPYEMHNGHIIAAMQGQSVLIDTGSPFSFSLNDVICVGDTPFSVPRQIGDITPEGIGDFVGCEVEALAGCDILNKYDVTIDPVDRTITLSDEIQPFGGEAYDTQFALGVPILGVTVRGENQRLCFDTGAQLSYLSKALMHGLEPRGQVDDFHPTMGHFQAQTALVPMMLAGENIDILCGEASNAVMMMLQMANVTGVLGSAVFTRFKVHLSARTQKIYFQTITYGD